VTGSLKAAPSHPTGFGGYSWDELKVVQRVKCYTWGTLEIVNELVVPQLPVGGRLILKNSPGCETGVNTGQRW